jgi:hypothetical protein
MYINVCKIKRKAACDSRLATQKGLDHILDLWQPPMRKERSALIPCQHSMPFVHSSS